MGWRLELFSGDRSLAAFDVEERVVIGRQDGSAGEEHLACLRVPGDPHLQRITAIAEGVANVSRNHARVESAGAGRVRLTNLTEKLAIGFQDRSTLGGRGVKELDLPAWFSIGPVSICVTAGSAGETVMLEPVGARGDRASGVAFPVGLVGKDDTGALFRWLSAAQDVLQSAASAKDFYERAARALVELVDLDFGRVFEFADGVWCTTPAAQVLRSASVGEPPRPSSRVLNSVRTQRKVCYEVPQDTSDGRSIADVEALVAAPVLDADGNVRAALYGDRVRRPGSMAVPSVGELEARLVELLAGGIGAGLARVEQERKTEKAQQQFEQFFSPELARSLAKQPDLLQPRDMPITALFCDIRGFSRVSEKHGPKVTLEWVGDVMDTLSDCILAAGGVVVDYIGDELFAMFGAPEPLSDHADRACRAGLGMLVALGKINARWQARLGEPTGIGIGINTGVARVGNTGSSRRFKYGALGNTVNLASRVQGVNKYLHTTALFTDSTRAALVSPVTARRLCRVEVVNIHEPVGLNQLVTKDEPGFDALKNGYEQALDAFEQGNARKAARLLGSVLEDHPDDGPSLRLLARAVEGITDPAQLRPVWVLPGK